MADHSKSGHWKGWKDPYDAIPRPPRFRSETFGSWMMGKGRRETREGLKTMSLADLRLTHKRVHQIDRHWRELPLVEVAEKFPEVRAMAADWLQMADRILALEKEVRQLSSQLEQSTSLLVAFRARNGEL